MPKYTVNLSVTVEANNEQEARRYISNQLLKGRWNEAKIVDIQRQISACDSGLSGETNFDNIILSEIDEDDSDGECPYQTCKKIFEKYSKGEN